jgi:pimeloyl-ACP methyl ester carboxylesterase
MTARRHRRYGSGGVALWLGLLVALLVATSAVARPPASPAERTVSPSLDWLDCTTSYQCATLEVPRDYARPWERTWRIALIRRPAPDPSARIGSLILNPGGPGVSGTAFLADIGNALALRVLNRRFDLVAFDPRGVGDSEPAVRCLTDQEAQAQFADPFPRPDTLELPSLIAWASGWVDKCVTRDPGVLPYLSTANVARDLDRLRAAVGDPKLSYLGFSYGTLIGVIYAELFPRRVRALALDAPVDPEVWLEHPLEATQQQLAAFERALERFFVQCARGNGCQFGGADPEAEFDRLVDSLDANPIPALDPYAARPPVNGDTVLVAAAGLLGRKSWWPFLAGDLAEAENGTGTGLRGDADLYWGIDSNGAYDATWDRNLAISALDQQARGGPARYLRTARNSYAKFPHFWWSSGAFELPWGLYPVRPRGVLRGPFRMSPDSPPALVVGTRYDPSTPYVWAKRLTAQLGNARLLTMIGDGHTAWFNSSNSSCVRTTVTVYLEQLEVPAPGTACPQD